MSCFPIIQTHAPWRPLFPFAPPCHTPSCVFKKVTVWLERRAKVNRVGFKVRVETISATWGLPRADITESPLVPVNPLFGDPALPKTALWQPAEWQSWVRSPLCSHMPEHLLSWPAQKIHCLGQHSPSPPGTHPTPPPALSTKQSLVLFCCGVEALAHSSPVSTLGCCPVEAGTFGTSVESKGSPLEHN